MTRVTRVYSSWALYSNLQLRGAPCTHQIHRFKMNHIHNELHPPPWWPSPGTLGVLQEADTPWPGPSCLEWPAGCSLWGSLQKKKSTSDFPIETLSKIEDFHGFPPNLWLPGAYWVYMWVWTYWTWHIPGHLIEDKLISSVGICLPFGWTQTTFDSSVAQSSFPDG